MPGQGVSTMFRFGKTARGDPLRRRSGRARARLVTPAVWKKHFGITADKGRCPLSGLAAHPVSRASLRAGEGRGSSRGRAHHPYGAEKAGMM